MAKTKVIATLKENDDVRIIIEIDDIYSAEDDEGRKLAAWNKIRNTPLHIAYNYFLKLYDFTFE